MKLTVTLTQGQHDRLKIHAKEKGRSEEEDMVEVWWGRVKALDKYAEKLVLKDATFRPYAPKLLPDDERAKLKKLALAEGIAPKLEKKRSGRSKERTPGRNPGDAGSIPARSTKIKPGSKKLPRIDLYDDVGPAMSKAAIIAEATGKTVAAVLKAAKRDAKGELIK